MKTPIVEYEGDQLEIDFSEIDFDLDRPQFSICPKCSGDIIRLADGCHICGWSENESRSVESSLSIPCTVKQPNQPEQSGVIKQDLGSRFLIDIPSENSDEISRGEPESEIISRGEQFIPTSKKRREKGRGTAYIQCRPITKNGKQYKQYWFHWEEWREGDRVIKKSRYIPKRLVPKVERMNQEKVAVSWILEVLGVKR